MEQTVIVELVFLVIKFTQNNKSFLVLSDFLEGNKKKAITLIKAIDINEDSNLKRLEHHTTLHLYIQIIIEGGAYILKNKFLNSKKYNHFKLLQVKKAIALHHSFSRQISTSKLLS